MGFFDWLMKGVGFESEDTEEVNQKPTKQKRIKKRRARLNDKETVDDAEPSFSEFGSSSYVQSKNQNSFETYQDFDGVSSVGGYGTKNVVIHHPKTYKEVQGIIDYLKQGESAIIILDGLSASEAQRILDFVSGAVYALSGSTQRIEGNIFLLTPEGYNIVKQSDAQNPNGQD